MTGKIRIAEISDIAGALAYGKTKKEAKANVYAIALVHVGLDEASKGHVVSHEDVVRQLAQSGRIGKVNPRDCS